MFFFILNGILYFFVFVKLYLKHVNFDLRNVKNFCIITAICMFKIKFKENYKKTNI